MKKFLSLLLSIVMLLSVTAGIDMSAYAGGWLDNVKKIEFNTIYTESMSTSDYCNDYKHGVYVDSFKFYVPVDGSVVYNFRTECKDYVWKYTGVQENRPTSLELFSSNDFNNPIVSHTMSRDFNEATGEYYDSIEFYLTKGTYYITVNYKAWVYYYNGGAYFGSYNFDLDYNPNIIKPSKIKVSARNTNNLKLSWNKVAGVSGYQLQRKSGNSYKTVANTASTSYTVKNLSAGTSYAFRVRAYKTVNGKKYYSSWTNLTTPTKPAKPSIKNPATNKKHQIIAKWNRVSRCTGYQVQYSKKKNFSSIIATKTVSGSSKTSYTGKNFT
ncbi:MAG: fibronectin type III domain-containing protein, partial [Acetobacter sp.]|nr:fibronectin type III domain-containing protein [Bacteroides sp.]MCM1341536.1 fibronectin type III domain-containing protein [Acetobacter sp.]